MAAGGYKEFVAGETLDQDEINDYLMQGMLVFAGTAARGSAITSPVEGQFSFLKDSDSVEFFDGSQWVELESGDPVFQYLIIGGGAGGGDGTSTYTGGGGGAGGYISSVTGENSGGTAARAAQIVFGDGETFGVTVGAGGASNTKGSESLFAGLVAVGGGRGDGATASFTGGAAGSGGGANLDTRPVGVAISNQGFNGGLGSSSASGGGGGGAGQVGGAASGTNGGAGGNGLASSITGSSVTRAGGGGGCANGGTAGAAGAGGGGIGGAALNTVAGSGSVNTGGGGGGSRGPNPTAGGAGGSGVVILKYPSKVTLTVGVGLTSSTVTSGDFKITSFTAGTDTVTVGF